MSSALPFSTISAGVHHRHVVRHVRNNTEIVRNQDDRHACRALQLAQQIQNLGLNCHVESRCRFVGDKDRRLAGNRHCNHRALQHAAGKGKRILVARALRLQEYASGPTVPRLGRTPSYA